MSKYDPSKEYGRSGLVYYDGWVEDEFLRELRGERAQKIYRQMETNPVLGGILTAIVEIICGVNWRVDPGDDEKAGEFVDSCRNDMSSSWIDTLKDWLSFVSRGFSYNEIVYKRRLGQQKDPSKKSKYKDGKIGWRKIAGRAQETIVNGGWDIDEAGGIKGAWQSAAPDYHRRYIPIEKALLFRTTMAKGNPEGISYFRRAYEPWYYYREIMKLEGIGFGRDLAGIPFARVPRNVLAAAGNEKARPEDIAALEAHKKMVTNIRRDEQEGLILSSERDEGGNYLYDFSLLTSGGSRQFDTSSAIMRNAKFMALALLSNVMLLGIEGRAGSFALSKEQGDWMLKLINGILNSMTDIFNRHAITRLLDINGMLTEKPPTLEHGGVKPADIAVIGQFLLNMINAGVIEPDPKLEAFARKLAGVPAKEEE